MTWFRWRTLGVCALLTGACSDDGVPATADGTDTGASASGPDTAAQTGDGPPGTAVTTADPTSTASESDSDVTATTDPSGGDTDEGTNGTDGSTGGVGSSTGGSTDGGSSTGGTPEPECVLDEDCMLVDDCCACEAIPVGEDPAKCEIMSCFVSTCTSFGLGTPAVECNFGTCEVEEVSCDPALVTCDELPPDCGDGQAPRVVEGCYDGCVPVEYCDVVPSCEACGEDEACVASVQLGGSSVTCVPIPPSCEGAPSCDCLGEACEAPFDACADEIDAKSGAELTCSCLAC